MAEEKKEEKKEPEIEEETEVIDKGIEKEGASRGTCCSGPNQPLK
jgi:hypothetical protein